MNEKKTIRVFIRGRVQGVFFRMETLKAAHRYGICGWVRNLPDGRVEAVLEGTPEKVNQMLGWCNTGPPMASVTGVDVEEVSDPGGFMEFTIRR